jgi:hypothetical protein
MVSRRSILAGLGGLAAGGGAVLGTGAFTAVEAQRTVAVETTGDADAFLGIEPLEDPNADYVTAPTDGTVEIDITDEGTDAAGAGVNKNAITSIDRLLEVRNNGTQDVYAGFDNQYGLDPPGKTTLIDKLPAGWGYSVTDDDSAVVVAWMSPFPGDMDNTLEEVRPDLASTGFGGSSTLVDGNTIRQEVSKRDSRKIAPGENLHIGAIVDTRRSTITDNPIPSELDSTITLSAESTN